MFQKNATRQAYLQSVNKENKTEMENQLPFIPVQCRPGLPGDILQINKPFFSLRSTTAEP